MYIKKWFCSKAKRRKFMKYLLLLLSIVFVSHCYNHRVLPFSDPVVDPEPPGVNPTEPIFPFDGPCKRQIVYQNNCNEKLNDLQEKIIELQKELELLQIKNNFSCLSEIKGLSSKFEKFEAENEVKLNLNGSKQAYHLMIQEGYLKEVPSFYKNIRYTKANKVFCVLNE